MLRTTARFQQVTTDSGIDVSRAARDCLDRANELIGLNILDCVAVSTRIEHPLHEIRVRMARNNAYTQIVGRFLANGDHLDHVGCPVFIAEQYDIRANGSKNQGLHALRSSDDRKLVVSRKEVRKGGSNERLRVDNEKPYLTRLDSDQGTTPLSKSATKRPYILLCVALLGIVTLRALALHTGKGGIIRLKDPTQRDGNFATRSLASLFSRLENLFKKGEPYWEKSRLLKSSCLP
jgi:hypothetical protein